MTTGITNENDIDVSQLGMFVIDVLRYDVETLSSILKLLNDDGCIGWRFAWPHNFTKKEVTDALEELLRKGLVLPLHEDKELKELVPLQQEQDIWIEGIDAIWFDITKKGWDMWHKWDDPPIEEEAQNE